MDYTTERSPDIDKAEKYVDLSMDMKVSDVKELLHLSAERVSKYEIDEEQIQLLDDLDDYYDMTDCLRSLRTNQNGTLDYMDRLTMVVSDKMQRTHYSLDEYDRIRNGKVKRVMC